jgi:hypothetical protein
VALATIGFVRWVKGVAFDFRWRRVLTISGVVSELHGASSRVTRPRCVDSSQDMRPISLKRLIGPYSRACGRFGLWETMLNGYAT